MTIADSLQQQIESGEVRDGDRLPSQHDMAKQFGVSLTTLRSAVDLLEQRGYVRSAHGLGTFAQAPINGSSLPQVLLVDDDPQVVDLLSAILEGEDLSVTSASTAAEGIAKLEAGSFQAIFLDLIMPGGTGIELLKAVESHDEQPPVVLVTGAADTNLINEAMDHGPITLIRKPVRVKQVRQVLEVLNVQKRTKA